MKVALCISGQPRIFDNEKIVEAYYKYIIDVLHTDVFIDTWEGRGKKFSNIKYGVVQMYCSDEKISEKQIDDLYHPKDIRVQSYEEWEKTDFVEWENNDPNEKNRIVAKNGLLYKAPIVGQAFKIYGANLLKSKYEEKYNFKYDMVIRSRFDHIFYKPIEEDYLKNLDVLWNNNCPYIYMPYRVHDTFLFSNSSIMDTFSNIYLHLQKYWDDNRYLVLDRYDPPRIIKVCCDAHNIKDKSFKDRSIFENVNNFSELDSNPIVENEDRDNRIAINEIEKIIGNGIEIDKLHSYVRENNWRINIYNWLVKNHYIRKDENMRYWQY